MDTNVKTMSFPGRLSDRRTERGDVGGRSSRGSHQRVFAGVAVLLAFTSLASPASAQTIRGVVVELSTERPVQLAAVMMISESGDTVAFTLTDDNGYYAVTSSDDGMFMLVTRALGYRTKREGPFDLEEEDMRIVRFNLAPRAIQIAGLIVETDPMHAWLARNGFYERMEEGRGYFLTPEHIANSDAFFTQDLFKAGLEGRTRVDRMVAPWDASVSMRGVMGRYCTPRVYVNGVYQYLSPGEGFSLDDAVPMDEVTAVEVYQGFNERPPLRYRSTDQCGVILFWTGGGE